MGGMRRAPKGIRRTRDSTDRPATWYDIWYTGPESDGERVKLGRSERLADLANQKAHRFYPQDGSWPQVIKGWTNGAQWLMECWRSAKARTDATTAVEDEEVLE